jgi:FO synthase subunit 1
MSPEEVIKLVRRAKTAGCSEALLTLGEQPEVHTKAREKLEEFGYENTVEYLVDLCKKILEVGLLPHTNAGVLEERELRLLRRYNASMGLMLECTAVLPAHQESPGKDPRLRLKTIEAAGRLRIPFTTGLLVGIGESFEDRVRSLLALQELHERYGHIQEIIIQPFAPKPNTPMANCPPPSVEELLETVAIARSMMPEMNIQVPPNLLGTCRPCLTSDTHVLPKTLSDVLPQTLMSYLRHQEDDLGGAGGADFEGGVKAVLRAGANDFGGVSTLTPDFINPEHPWPSVAELRGAIGRAGFVPRERLPIYPRYVRDEKFMSREVRKLVLELADEGGYRAR